MQLEAVLNITHRPKSDLVIVPFYTLKNEIVPAISIPDLNSAIQTILTTEDFDAKQGTTLLIYLSEMKGKRLLLLGLGEEKSLSMEVLRRSYGAALKQCRNKKWHEINVILPKSDKLEQEAITRACVEGITLASYLYNEWKAEENKKPFYIDKITFIGTSDLAILKKTEGILSGVNLARNLVNRNAADVTPYTLSQEAKKIAAAFSTVSATILSKKELEKEKMGLLLAVGAASKIDPALIILEYRGAPHSNESTMVVGKGITFDSGGLNLKPTNFIEDMRADMAGAAAAIGLIQAAATIKLKTNIVAVVPSTENAIDSNSYKPGDVYRSYSGKTVEIGNTDAEGRLVLADALSYGQKQFHPTRIIDLATLTGAIVIALGDIRAGLYSNNDTLARLCEKAGEITGERIWRMPLDPEYREYLKSEIADIKNISSKRMAGSVLGAIFLQEFIDNETPWIHLDIAGTAFLNNPKDYHLSQATGTGVRLLVELLESL